MLYDEIANGNADRFLKGGKGNFHLITDLARAEKNGFEIGGGAVNRGREKFLHADGGASAVDIAREGQKLLGLDHFNGFFANGGSRLFQMKLLCGRDHENVIFARLTDGDQGFENVSRVLSERRRKIDGGDRARGQITVALIRDLFLIEDPHDVGFFFFCHRKLLSDKLAEAFDAVERGVVGIVEVSCVIDRGAAKIDDILALDLKINVLEADLLTVLVTVIVEIADDVPFAQIVGADEGEQISVARMCAVIDARGDGIVFFRYLIVFDHEFGIVAGEGHTASIGELCFMILRVDGVNERGLIFAEAHDIDKLSVGVDCERAFNGHGLHRKIFERGIEAVKGSRLGKAPIFRHEEIVVLIAGHDHGGMRIYLVCPRAPFQRFINSAVVTENILRIFVNARVTLLAVGASEKCDGGRERLAAVGRFADQQIAVFRGAGEHIKLALMNEHFPPEAGHKLAYVVPSLAVIVGTEDQGQILRMLARKKVHGREQKAVGMANERGRAEKSARKSVCFILGVQIIDDRSDRLAATGKTRTAFFTVGNDVKFIFRLIGKSRNITFCLIGRRPMNKISFAALTVINIVAGIADG